MSNASFTGFSQLPTELQLKVWEKSIGRTRIHILHPAPFDVFHWYQDFACPLYLAIDARTNKPIEGNPLLRLAPLLSCKAALEELSRRLVKADLFSFEPDAIKGHRSPSTCQQEVDIIVAKRHNRDVIKIFNFLVQFADWLRTSLRNEERLRQNHQSIIETTTGFKSINDGLAHNIGDHLPALPQSVYSSFQMHFAAIGRSIGGALRALQNYQDNLDSAKARDKHRRAGRKHVLVLQLDLERALRGIEHWAMPGPAHALLLGALDFDSAEARRARQSFSVATDRDLVYVTDPRCCDLFLHVWGSPWCKKVRYLAVLVVDCAVQMEWYNADVAVRARHTWPFQALLFEGCEVREIMLVVRPAVNPRNLPAEQSQRRERLLALPRDVYGFVDYGTLHGDTDLFSAMDSNVIKQNFTTYRRDLGEMIPEDLKQKIKLRFVVDLDCESIGMTNVEGAGAVYKRSLRN